MDQVQGFADDPRSRTRTPESNRSNAALAQSIHDDGHHEDHSERRHHHHHYHQHNPDAIHDVNIEIISHSYAKPLNPPPDLSLDARRLHNPPAELRHRCDGRDKRLRKECLKDQDFLDMLAGARDQICDLVDSGLRDLRVGVFCVRGRHRSVAFAEELAHHQRWFKGWLIQVHHRDVDRLKSEVDGEVRRERRRRDRERIQAGLAV